jgi:hypothetical protein
LKCALVDARCGACCDGLQAGGMNRNQGAESTLAWLWTAQHSLDVLPAQPIECRPEAASA